MLSRSCRPVCNMSKFDRIQGAGSSSKPFRSYSDLIDQCLFSSCISTNIDNNGIHREVNQTEKVDHMKTGENKRKKRMITRGRRRTSERRKMKFVFMKFVNNTPGGILTELGVRHEANEIRVSQNFNFLSFVFVKYFRFLRSLLYRCPVPLALFVITITPLNSS